MIRWILLAVLVVAISAAVPVVLSVLPADSTGAITLHPVPARVGPVGQLLVEGKPEYDFGDMAQQSTGSHDWVVKNVGSGDLELTKGSSTCMCTVADFTVDPKTGKARESLVLKPGDSTTITLTWKTKDSHGRFEKSASFLTSDPEHPEFWFRIMGSVEPAIMMQPTVPDFDFGSVANKEPSQARWALSSPDKPDFKILSITSSRPDILEADVKPLTTEEQAELKFKSGYRIDITLKPTTELGAFQEELIVKTDHPKQPEVRAAIHGNRVGPVSLVPGSIRINDANSIDGGSRTLLVTVRDQEGPTRFEVENVPAKLQVKIEPADDPNHQDSKVHRYRLTATVPPGTAPGISQGELVLKTDHPYASQVKVPVNVVVLSGSK